MVEKVREFILSARFDDALSLIESEIKKQKGKRSDEKYLQELIALRVTANTLALKNDDAVIHSVHKMKYPYSESFTLSNRGRVNLMDSDIFFVESDAYVNAIFSPETPSLTDRSFTNSLKKRIGKLEPKDFKKLKEHSPIFIVEHSELSAPFSYHITAITESNQVDYLSLTEGITLVLKDALENDLKKVCFAALGMATDPAPQEKKKIINAIVKTIDKFFSEVAGANNIEIIFPFINMSSFAAFKEGFFGYTPDGKVQQSASRNLDEAHSILVEKTRTKNPKYIEDLRKLAASVINDERLILFLGETGVGKSYLAEQCHYLSPRRKNNFEVLNCAMVIPEQLFTMVFGWGKEVYAGSPKGGLSIFDKAEGGTVFFDEIGYTSKTFQKQLLLFLDTKKYKKVGDQNEYQADVRLMFGTNQNLEKLMKEDKLVQDFYFRIVGDIELRITPLRERPEDIKSFIEGELHQLNQKHGKNITLENTVLEILISNNWPGNYRQLKKYIQSRYFDCQYYNTDQMTEEHIRSNPPQDIMLIDDNRYIELENLLTKVMSEWDSDKLGKFKNDYIDPLISKVYLENLSGKYKKSSAPNFLGMDYRDNRLEKLSQAYKDLLNRLK